MSQQVGPGQDVGRGPEVELGRDAGPGRGHLSEEVVYRGVKWRRSRSGRTMWFNEGLRRWALWSPGSDAPPLPEQWAPVPKEREVGGPSEPKRPDVRAEVGEPEGLSGGAPSRGAVLADAMSRRPSMRSPYRLVPVAVAVLIVGVAVYQAARPPGQATKQDIAAAQALQGRCLARSGGTAQYPHFSATPVSCSSSDAAVKVVAVFMPDKPSPCSASGLVARVGPALQGEPLECLVPVGPR